MVYKNTYKMKFNTRGNGGWELRSSISDRYGALLLLSGTRNKNSLNTIDVYFSPTSMKSGERTVRTDLAAPSNQGHGLLLVSCFSKSLECGFCPQGCLMVQNGYWSSSHCKKERRAPRDPSFL